MYTMGYMEHVHTVVWFLSYSHRHGPVDCIYRCDNTLPNICDVIRHRWKEHPVSVGNIIYINSLSLYYAKKDHRITLFYQKHFQCLAVIRKGWKMNIPYLWRNPTTRSHTVRGLMILKATETGAGYLQMNVLTIILSTHFLSGDELLCRNSQ